MRTRPQASSVGKVKVDKGHIQYGKVRSIGRLDTTSTSWASANTSMRDDEGIL